MKYTELEGVVLTPNAIAQLKELQMGGSEIVNNFTSDLDVLLDVVLDSSRSGVFELSEAQTLRQVHLLRDLKSTLINLKLPEDGIRRQ